MNLLKEDLVFKFKYFKILKQYPLESKIDIYKKVFINSLIAKQEILPVELTNEEIEKMEIPVSLDLSNFSMDQVVALADRTASNMVTKLKENFEKVEIKEVNKDTILTSFLHFLNENKGIIILSLATCIAAYFGYQYVKSFFQEDTVKIAQLSGNAVNQQIEGNNKIIDSLNHIEKSTGVIQESIKINEPILTNIIKTEAGIKDTLDMHTGKLIEEGNVINIIKRDGLKVQFTALNSKILELEKKTIKNIDENKETFASLLAYLDTVMIILNKKVDKVRGRGKGRTKISRFW